MLQDKNQHRKEEAEERFKEICNAYEARQRICSPQLVQLVQQP